MKEKSETATTNKYVGNQTTIQTSLLILCPSMKRSKQLNSKSQLPIINITFEHLVPEVEYIYSSIVKLGLLD